MTIWIEIKNGQTVVVCLRQVEGSDVAGEDGHIVKTAFFGGCKDVLSLRVTVADRGDLALGIFLSHEQGDASPTTACCKELALEIGMKMFFFNKT